MPEKKCTGNCLGCSFQQQVYCAAQHGHAIMSYIPALMEKIEKIEACLINTESAGFINPLSGGEKPDNEVKEEAQKGIGAIQ